MNNSLYGCVFIYSNPVIISLCNKSFHSLDLSNEMTFFIATMLSNDMYECLVGLVDKGTSLIDNDKYTYYIIIDNVDYFDMKAFYHTVWMELTNKNLHMLKCIIDTRTKMINIRGTKEHYKAFSAILTNYMTRYYKVKYISYTLYARYTDDLFAQPMKYTVSNINSDIMLDIILKQVHDMIIEEHNACILV